jgi:hypothetical protein
MAPGMMGVPSFRMTRQGLLEVINRHWCAVSYLILNMDIRELVEWTEKPLPANFAKTMADLVYGYVYENKMPPPEISQTILNVSEDFVAGKAVQLRAGDYIAVQQYLRAHK